MHDPTRHSSERVSRGRFDMIATFTEETRARQALADLRTAGFGPNQALLLQPADDSPNLLSPTGQITFPSAELVADRAVAIWVIICTECAVGALAGALVGWIIALFLNAPNIEPVWTWMLALGAIGAAAGIALGSLEWRKWKRETDTCASRSPSACASLGAPLPLTWRGHAAFWNSMAALASTIPEASSTFRLAQNAVGSRMRKPAGLVPTTRGTLWLASTAAQNARSASRPTLHHRLPGSRSAQQISARRRARGDPAGQMRPVEQGQGNASRRR